MYVMRRLGCLVACLLACGPSRGTPKGTNSGTEGAETGPTSSGALPTSTATIADATSSGDGSSSAETGAHFIVMPDEGFICAHHEAEYRLNCDCDIWKNNCGPGDKCIAWANDGGDRWNTVRCAEVVPTPDLVGEPCQVEMSPVAGRDTCAAAAMCWNVDELGEGTCVALCGGDELNPECPDGHVCMITNDGVLNLCLPACDPIGQDCGDGQGCYPGVGGFACLPASSPNVGECPDVGGCAAGTVCDVDVCTPICAVADPACEAGLECVPFFPGGDVGYCAAPL